jgi:hypothetical protein
MLPTMNIVVSNVRGPDVPMFLAGAQMVAFAPVSISMDGLGLNITGFSYHGTLWMCAVACRDMIPDPGFFADCLRSSFADLVAAADKVHANVAAPAPGAKRKSPVRKPAVSQRKAAKKAVKSLSRAPRPRPPGRRKTA